MKRVACLLLCLLPALGALAIGCSPQPGEREARGDAVSLDEQLVQRLAIAYGALRDGEGARTLEDARRYARVAIDAIAGPQGRHGAAYAPPGGVLPADGDGVTDEPGLALRVYDAAPAGSPLRAAVNDTVMGDVAAWRTPRDRYDAIDRAVADRARAAEAIAALNGESERALAWALSTLKTDNVVEARTLAGRGAQHAKKALDAVRLARSAQGVGSRE